MEEVRIRDDDVIGGNADIAHQRQLAVAAEPLRTPIVGTSHPGFERSASVGHR